MLLLMNGMRDDSRNLHRVRKLVVKKMVDRSSVVNLDAIDKIAVSSHPVSWQPEIRRNTRENEGVKIFDVVVRKMRRYTYRRTTGFCENCGTFKLIR